MEENKTKIENREMLEMCAVLNRMVRESVFGKKILLKHLR